MPTDDQLASDMRETPSPLTIDLARRHAPLEVPEEMGETQDLSGREPYDPAVDQAEVDDAVRSRLAGAGETVAGDVAPQWTSPMEAFLDSSALEVPSGTIKLERPNGWKVELVVTTMPTPRYNKVVEAHTQWKRDPQTQEREQVTDDRAVKCRFVIEGLKQIDFNDPKLWERYGATDPHHLVERMFLKGEIDRITAMVTRLSGFKLDDLAETAGNS